MEDVSTFFWGLVFLVYSTCFLCIYYLTKHPVINVSDPASEIIPMNVSVSRNRTRRLARNEALIIRKDNGEKMAKESPFLKSEVDSKRILKAIKMAQEEMVAEADCEPDSEKEHQDDISNVEAEETDDYVVVPKGLLNLENALLAKFEVIGKE